MALADIDFGVGQFKKTGRLKPPLHKQNLPPQVEDRAVKITLSFLHRAPSGLRLTRDSGFNRHLIRSQAYWPIFQKQNPDASQI